ncbi:MAG: hypothetical protein P4L34_06955 [Paludibacter sp.]|nr:hypothetical protein [Paludibacter sp.]
MKKKYIIYLVLSAFVGITIAYIDSQPNWDDTGITVFMILSTSAFFGFLTNYKPWLIALAVSSWIPLWAIGVTHNYAGFVALIPGFIGAFVGYFIKKTMSKPRISK